VLDQRLGTRSGTADSSQRQGRLVQIVEGFIQRRASKAGGPSNEGDPSSPQPFGISGSDEMLLSLIQMGEQHGILLFEIVLCIHAPRLPNDNDCVNAIF